MKDYLEIFSDVVLLATFQPRWRERFPSQRRIDEAGRSRLHATFAPGCASKRRSGSEEEGGVCTASRPGYSARKSRTIGMTLVP